MRRRYANKSPDPQSIALAHRLPITDYRLPIPHSPFPIPHSPFPIPLFLASGLATSPSINSSPDKLITIDVNQSTAFAL
ncbi:hypothetical protein [Tolypothrix sp. NIES-4075]|uniref:hypothetical protein n=1 Tax=Tolypothrix sp. NIES-4075 TaxID=2005459 RepID=UPI0013597F4A|nr:hypothetical protein [Tolypothrix sp. NIES-4075]